MATPENVSAGDRLLAIQAKHLTNIAFIQSVARIGTLMAGIEAANYSPSLSDESDASSTLRLVNSRTEFIRGMGDILTKEVVQSLIEAEIAACRQRTAPWLGAHAVIRGARDEAGKPLKRAGYMAGGNIDGPTKEVMHGPFTARPKGFVPSARYIFDSLADEVDKYPTVLEGELTDITPARLSLSGVSLKPMYACVASGERKGYYDPHKFDFGQVVRIFDPGYRVADRDFPTADEWQDHSAQQPPLTQPLKPQITIEFPDLVLPAGV